MHYKFILLLGLLVSSTGSCNNPQSTADTMLASPSADINGKSYSYDFSQPTARFPLPDILEEVSGIAWAGENTLACVQDERGIIFMLDLQKNKITDRFNFAGKGDYEDIAFNKGKFYVLRSDGKIFITDAAGRNTSSFSTQLDDDNDTEGLVWHPQLKQLLIACKAEPLKGNKKDKAIYAVDLKEEEIDKSPYIELTEKALEKHQGKKRQFSPSGIAIHPATGDYYIISANRPGLIVLDKSKKFKQFLQMSAEYFAQPEGICFSPQGSLFISNEAAGGVADVLQFDPK